MDSSPISAEPKRKPAERIEDMLVDLYKDKLMDFYNEYPLVKSVEIDYKDLELYSSQAADELEVTPYDALKKIKNKVEELDHTRKVRGVNIRIANYDGIFLDSLKRLRSDVIGKFISFDGLVKRKSDIIPRIKMAMFECNSCMRLHEIKQKTDVIVEPSLCKDCGGRNFRLLAEECEYVDMQVLSIQEPLENLAGRETPRVMTVLIEDDLVETVTPGELLRLTGILKVIKKKNQDNMRYLIECNHIQVLEKEYEDIELSPEDEERMQEMGKDPEIFSKLRNSVAPTIKGMDTVKDSIVLQLFSGTEKTLTDGSRKRNDIHLLIVGDPGIGKSDMMTTVSKHAPGGIFTSGKGSSAAGLTAAAVRDETGGWTLEAGALVLGDRGHVCVDEFDKMRPEDRSALHEAMEQQQISVAKAGITATLNSRCSIMAAANPKYGRFDKFKPIGEQIDLPATILSRFDIIFPIEDVPDEQKDSDIAWHILDIHENDDYLKYDINTDDFKKYIAYARQNCQPRVKGKAKEKIHDFYVEMRSLVQNREDPIPITPRQLEGMIRLTEASAKAHLREDAIVEDAERAIDIMKDYLQRVGFDAVSGKIDVDKVEGRQPKSWHEKVNKTTEVLEWLEEYYGTMPKHEIVLEEVSIKLNESEENAEKLIKEARAGKLLQWSNK